MRHLLFRTLISFSLDYCHSSLSLLLRGFLGKTLFIRFLHHSYRSYLRDRNYYHHRNFQFGNEQCLDLKKSFNRNFSFHWWKYQLISHLDWRPYIFLLWNGKVMIWKRLLNFGWVWHQELRSCCLDCSWTHSENYSKKNCLFNSLFKLI